MGVGAGAAVDERGGQMQAEKPAWVRGTSDKFTPDNYSLGHRFMWFDYGFTGSIVTSSIHVVAPRFLQSPAIANIARMPVHTSSIIGIRMTNDL